MFDLSNMLTRVKALKKEAGLTNETLAKIADIPKSTLDKILAGFIKDPSIISIIKLSKALNVSTDYLLGLSPFKNKFEYDTSVKYKNRVSELLEEYSGVNSLEITAALSTILRGLNAEILGKYQRKIFEIVICLLNDIGGMLENFEAIAEDPTSSFNPSFYHSNTLMAADIPRNSTALFKSLQDVTISVQTNNEDKSTLKELMSIRTS